MSLTRRVGRIVLVSRLRQHMKSQDGHVAYGRCDKRKKMI